MTTYFEELHIGQILQSTDIVDLIGNYLALKPQGKDLVGLCPFHNDRRPSMSVSPAKQIFKCFSCGAGGDAIKFIMLKERMTFPESVKYLAERANIQLPERQNHNYEKPQFDKNKLEEINRWAAKYFRSQYEEEIFGKTAREYIQNRGIEDNISRKFGLGWAPAGWDNLLNAAIKDQISLEALAQLGLLVEKDTGGYYDRFRERVIFPVLDGLKRVIAFGGRTLANDPAKYLNSPESVLFDKSSSLYGLHAAKDEIVKNKTAIVVEGYTDCIMAHQQGVYNVVATLGTAMTKEHARMLGRYANRIILMFDSDQAGIKAGNRAIELFFGLQVEIELISLPDGQDPCDFLLENGKKAFELELKKAKNAIDYKWSNLLQEYESADAINGRTLAIDQFLQIISQMAKEGNLDPIKKGLVVNKVAGLINQPAEIIHRRMARFTSSHSFEKLNNENPNNMLMLGNLDAVSKCYLYILEVILNCPDLYYIVIERLGSITNIDHPVLKQVAMRITKCCENTEKPNLGIILGGCESTQLCNIITDMAVSGESRGNYEKTLDGAFAALEGFKAKQERSNLKDMITNSAKTFDRDTLDVMLADLQARLIKDKTESN